MAASSAPANTASHASPSAGAAAAGASAADEYFRCYATTGDSRAFRALVDGHLSMVHATAWRRLGEHGHLAADVAQAVFTRLARVARGLPQGIVIAAWLHRQAVRLAIDTVRAETRRRGRETAAAAAIMVPISPENYPPSPGVHTLPGEIAPLLDEALDRLSETDRAALVLRYLEGRDLASVAACLKTTPEAARKRVARSLEKLRSLLARRGVAIPATSALSASLTQTQAQSAAAASHAAAATATTAAQTSPAFLTTSSAASAAKFTAAHISQTALAAAVSTGGPASAFSILTTLVMSHLSYAGAGAALVLIAAGLLYQQQESEIQRRVAARSAASPAITAVLTGADPTKPRPGSHAASGFHAAADDDGPKTLPEIIDALEKITTGPEGRLAGLQTRALLRKIPPDQYFAFYTGAGPRIPAARWQTLVSESIALWTDTAPKELTMALFASNNAKSREIRVMQFKGVVALNGFVREYGPDGGTSIVHELTTPFKAWAQRDPAAALNWVEAEADSPMMKISWLNPPLTLRDELLRQASGAVSAGTPLQNLTELSPGNADAIRKAWAAAQITGDRPLVDLLAQPWDATEWRAVCAAKASESPDTVRAWIDQLPPDDARRFDAALGILDRGRTMAGKDISFDREADFALGHSSGVPKPQALQEIALSWPWLGRYTQPSPLLDWLHRAGPPEETAQAMEAVARKLGSSEQFSDMPAAMDFAAGVPNAARRAELQRGLFLRWHDALPDVAESFLQNAPPETAALLKPLTTPSARP